MPQAVRKGAAPAVRRIKGLDVLAVPLSLRGSLNLWHKRINVLSGDMVLCYKATGIPRETLRRWALEFRLLADEVEKVLREPGRQDHTATHG